MPCIFCGHPKTTNEHVFPQWLLDVIPGDGALTHGWIAPEGSTSESRTWTTDGITTFKANVVCQKNCNGGWMNDLENAARRFLEPMIKGHGYTMHDTGGELVAYWGLKTAMMIDCAQEQEHRSVPAADYRALYAARGVLPNTFVWLAACDHGAGALARHRTLDLNIGDASVGGYGATVALGHLVIEIIRLEVEHGKALQIDGKLAAALSRLWPYDKPITWPPRVVLTRQNVVWLAQMIELSPIALLPL